ncbi:DUF1430 domain-containing protein [Enterococcus faecium]|uniref:DUF1430 domain-containing protein n=2 Tax=Enterococcus faecium TaxID=1352 RepID=UPI003565ADC4
MSILSSLALAVAIRNVNREEDFQKKVNTAEYFTPFRFPEFIVDPQQETRVLEILESVSEKLNVNYMAKVSFYGVRDHTFSETGEISFDRLGETHTFFLSKQTETHLLNNFYIEPQIISEKNYFASDLEKYPDAEYLENRQLKNEDFFILPIQMAEALNPADFFVIDLLGNLSLNKQLNRQTFGKGFFYTIYSVKMLILFFSVVQLVPLAEYARTFVTPEAVPEEIKNHAVFYPRLGGNEATLTDLSQDMRGLDKTKLLSQLLDDGAIEVDTSAYFEEENPLIHQSIYVNTNYLDKYPLISITNQPIQIDKNEDREIILIPERMIPDFVQLRSWFLNETNPDRRTKKEEDVLFYTIQDEQEIFAFDQEQAIIINQPNIIHVFTLNNLPISHRNILTGNSFAEPLKIPLIGTAQETYDRYLPLLKEAGLEDNFPFLIPMEQLRKTELQLIYLWDIRQRITDLSITILLVIVLITYSTLSYFRLYRQKFVVWRLNGVSFFKTYRRIFLLFGLQYLLFFIYVAVHSFRITDVFIFSLYILIVCIVLLSTFFLIEKKQNRLCESK